MDGKQTKKRAQRVVGTESPLVFFLPVGKGVFCRPFVCSAWSGLLIFREVVVSEDIRVV
jgi:hypothetical protein